MHGTRDRGKVFFASVSFAVRRGAVGIGVGDEFGRGGRMLGPGLGLAFGMSSSRLSSHLQVL